MDQLDDKDEFVQRRFGYGLVVVQMEAKWVAAQLSKAFTNEVRGLLFKHLRWAVDRYANEIDETREERRNGQHQGT